MGRPKKLAKLDESGNVIPRPPAAGVGSYLLFGTIAGIVDFKLDGCVPRQAPLLVPSPEFSDEEQDMDQNGQGVEDAAIIRRELPDCVLKWPPPANVCAVKFCQHGMNAR